MPVRPSKLKGEVLALDVAGGAQPYGSRQQCLHTLPPLRRLGIPPLANLSARVQQEAVLPLSSQQA